MSIGFFDYMLRLLCLAPIDLCFFGDNEMGYASILCKATNKPGAEQDDAFMSACIEHSLEFDRWRETFPSQLPVSSIRLKTAECSTSPVRRAEIGPLNLYETAKRDGSISASSKTQDSRLFLLSDYD